MFIAAAWRALPHDATAQHITYVEHSAFREKRYAAIASCLHIFAAGQHHSPLEFLACCERLPAPEAADRLPPAEVSGLQAASTRVVKCFAPKSTQHAISNTSDFQYQIGNGI